MKKLSTAALLAFAVHDHALDVKGFSVDVELECELVVKTHKEFWGERQRYFSEKRWLEGDNAARSQQKCEEDRAAESGNFYRLEKDGLPPPSFFKPDPSLEQMHVRILGRWRPIFFAILEGKVAKITIEGFHEGESLGLAQALTKKFGMWTRKKNQSRNCDWWIWEVKGKSLALKSENCGQGWGIVMVGETWGKAIRQQRLKEEKRHLKNKDDI
jgi:hypothetical protein